MEKGAGLSLGFQPLPVKANRPEAEEFAWRFSSAIKGGAAEFGRI
jgi:hypothetical protein